MDLRFTHRRGRKRKAPASTANDIHDFLHNIDRPLPEHSHIMPPSSLEKDVVSMANVNSNDDDDASVPQEEPPTTGGDDAQSHAAACQPMVPSPITTHPIVAAEEEELAEENLRSSTTSQQGGALPPERVENEPMAADDAVSTQAHSARSNLICAERQKDGEILLDKGGDAITFPKKLYAILEDPDNHHAIRWQPHGRSWKVHKRDIFMKKICPKYFSQTKFESFVRQSNGWGFRRLKRDGPDRNSYYHELFLRGQPELLKSIRRPLPGGKDECEEPDFYSMSPVHEEDQHQEDDQHQEEDQDLPTHVRLETTSNNENKKKRKKGSPEPERNTHGSSFYDGCMSYDPQRYGNMPPPPPPVWSGPPAYQYPPEYGHGPPAPFPFDSAGCPTSPAGGVQQVTYPSQPCTPNDIPPFDPSLYFPPPYYPLYPPPQPPQGPQALPSQDEDDSKQGGLHGLMPMPYYPTYPSPYYPHPGGILSTSRGFEDNPTGTFRYEFGSIPPYPLPPLRADIAESGDHESNEQRDGLKFSPIQRPDES